MDVTGIKNTSIQNYHSEASTQKSEDNTNNENVKTKYSRADTFVKSTENNTEPSTYKPVKNKLSTKEVQELKDSERN